MFLAKTITAIDIATIIIMYKVEVLKQLVHDVHFVILPLEINM